MPVKAYVLINIKPTREGDVYKSLSKIEGVSDIYPLFGEYDLIAKIEKEDVNEIGNTVINEIRSIEGIVDTKTLNGTTF